MTRGRETCDSAAKKKRTTAGKGPASKINLRAQDDTIHTSNAGDQDGDTRLHSNAREEATVVREAGQDPKKENSTIPATLGGEKDGRLLRLPWSPFRVSVDIFAETLKNFVEALLNFSAKC